MSVSIRKAEFEDREEIANVHKASIRHLCSEHYTETQISAWVGLLEPSVYDSAIDSKCFLVACNSEGRIIGLGMLDLKTADVNAVYVLPEAAGQGIGSSLLSKLEKAALKACIVKLRVFATVNAKGFYEKCGYVECGEACHELPGGVLLKCVEMEKVFQ